MTGMSRLSLGLTAALIVVAPAFADGQRGFLETIRHHSTLTSTVPDNGYLNPCAIVAAPVGRGFYYVEDDVNTVMEAR